MVSITHARREPPVPDTAPGREVIGRARALRYEQCGFTLVELMVAIAILGIVAVVALPALST